MSETKTRQQRPAISDPFHDSFQQPEGQSSDNLPAMVPRHGGPQVDQALAAHVTAQRVAVKRNLPDVLREVQALGAAAGADFYYRIPFKDRKGGEEKTTWVEGPSIDCAMAVATTYGNCWVGATISGETHEAWTFSAMFRDLEKGVTVVREFRQRKGQNTGMKDGGRQIDIVFQIGQSKAIRNVVVAALPVVVNAAYAAAMSSVLKRVEASPDKFREWLSATIDGMGIDIKRMERVNATPFSAWSNQQMARAYADLRAVKDGMVTVDELWPLPGSEDAPPQDGAAVSEAGMANGGDPAGDAETAQRQEPVQQPKQQQRQARQTKPKDQPPAETPKPEPEPEKAAEPAESASPAAPAAEPAKSASSLLNFGE